MMKNPGSIASAGGPRKINRLGRTEDENRQEFEDIFVDFSGYCSRFRF
jgi:hypothetical protein